MPEDREIAKAIWRNLAPMFGEYSEVPFEEIFVRTRYRHLREVLERTVQSVRNLL